MNPAVIAVIIMKGFKTILFLNCLSGSNQETREIIHFANNSWFDRFCIPFLYFAK